MKLEMALDTPAGEANNRRVQIIQESRTREESAKQTEANHSQFKQGLRKLCSFLITLAIIGAIYCDRHELTRLASSMANEMSSKLKHVANADSIRQSTQNEEQAVNEAMASK